MPNHTEEEWDTLIEHATDLAYSTLQLQRHLRLMAEEQGLTQQDIADKLGTNRHAVSNIESGDPVLSELRQYALVVGADIKFEVTERNKNDHKKSTDPAVGFSIPQ